MKFWSEKSALLAAICVIVINGESYCACPLIALEKEITGLSFVFKAMIHDFALISDKKVVKKVFMATMHKLLKVTKEAVKMNQLNCSGTMLTDSSSNEASLSHERCLLYSCSYYSCSFWIFVYEVFSSLNFSYWFDQLVQ